MKNLDIIVDQQLILKNILKMQLSVSDIRAKNAHRTDLINSLDESIDELTKVLSNHRKMEYTINAVERLNGDLNLKYYSVLQKLKEYEEKNNDFAVNETYIRNLEIENDELKNKIKRLLEWEI